MNDLMQADIFFFITSAALIILSVVLLGILIYVFLIVRDAKKVSGKVKEQTELISNDLNEMRQEMKREGRRVRSVINFFKKILSRTASKKTPAGKK